ncbi:MAG TPA: glucose 1-dehydrogenase [Burkholderiales bacterium]
MTDPYRTVISLKAQRALITGGSTGIGRSISMAFAAAGASVVVNYARSKNEAQQVVSEIMEHGGEAMAIQADVSDEDAVKRMFQQMFDRYSDIDILVNNAGIQKDSPLHTMTLASWRQVLDTNLTGQFLCSREAVNAFLRRGVISEVSCAAGKIICMSSVHDVIPWAGHANYAASKAGVTMLMKTMAQELAPHKIRVNAISPGAIRTRINTEAWATPQAEANLDKLIPWGHSGDPSDIARAALWLASDLSSYVTGATLYVDGGMTLYPGFAQGG